MGISFHVTSVREGTIFNVMQFLSLEKVTGTLSVSFGRHIPDALVFFVSGKAAATEFGDLKAEQVFDMLLCQEYAVKEINFQPGREANYKEDTLIKTPSLSGAMLNASKDVDQCGARPYIFGLLDVSFPETGQVSSLLQTFHEFNKHKTFLEAIKAQEGDREAPLPQCQLLHRALQRNIVTYKSPLVALKSFRPLLEIVQPLEEKEAENLRGYMRSLLPHPRATHMPLERFYAFASAVESIAYRRGSEVGDEARRIIYRLIQSTTKLNEPMNV
ncbi:MAG: DUF4388 domain-containing protein [Candidatus Obscuribacterales bacterium]|nr:DUF4388 domain-containing protein [Candidatus Obscuribacterales bacterium]